MTNQVKIYIRYSMMASKKKQKCIYLIGPEIKEIKGRKLPTKLQALKLFFHKHNQENLIVHKSAVMTVIEIEKMWQQAEIPVIKTQNSTNKLLKLHQTWKSLQKNCKKKTDTQRAKESKFKKDLDQLFDIARRDALAGLTSSTQEFLTSQRNKSRRGLLPVNPPVSDCCLDSSAEISDHDTDGDHPQSNEEEQGTLYVKICSKVVKRNSKFHISLEINFSELCCYEFIWTMSDFRKNCQ